MHPFHSLCDLPKNRYNEPFFQSCRSGFHLRRISIHHKHRNKVPTRVAMLPPPQYCVIIHMALPTGSASMTWLILRALLSLNIFKALTSFINSEYVSANRGLRVSLSSMSMIFTATIAVE